MANGEITLRDVLVMYLQSNEMNAEESDNGFFHGRLELNDCTGSEWTVGYAIGEAGGILQFQFFPITLGIADGKRTEISELCLRANYNLKTASFAVDPDHPMILCKLGIDTGGLTFTTNEQLVVVGKLLSRAYNNCLLALELFLPAFQWVNLGRLSPAQAMAEIWKIQENL